MFPRPDYFANARDLTRRIYHVACNHPEASDDNPGDERLPFMTISRAAALAEMYDRIVIDEGIYREEVRLVNNGHAFQPDGMIWFQAVPGKKVYLRGSDVFEPEWEHLGAGIYKAPLPECLFKSGAYNPYAISAARDDREPARPAPGTRLPETLGQVYVEGVAYRQLDSLDKVLSTVGSFIIPGEGRHLIVHFAGGTTPGRSLVEISVRERCIRPCFQGTVFVSTVGMVIEHAADPGPFCHGRELSIWRNAKARTPVMRTFAFPSNIKSCANLLGPDYATAEGNTMIGAIVDDLGRGARHDAAIYTVISHDAGRSWTPTGEVVHQDLQTAPIYFLDEEQNALVRHYRRYDKMDLDGAFGANRHETVFQISRDGAASWTEPEPVDEGTYAFGMLRMSDGRLLWPYSRKRADVPGMHQAMECRIGTWQNDGSLVWEDGGGIDVSPDKSRHGVAEPHLAEMPDGRIFALLRAGNVRPTQDSPGVPSVKLWSVSADGGATWSEPQPLLYDDGKLIYSARNMPDAVRSRKNGRVYLLINISGASAENCDPRTALHVMELDPETCRVKRDSVGVVEQMHPEHHKLVRYSNWASIQDRITGNLIVFLKMALSEYCTVRSGYDYNYYRYEIAFPTSGAADDPKENPE